MKLDSAVCIVTGSAVGVGAASAIQLAGKGAKVVVNFSKSEKEARETLAQCHAAGGEAQDEDDDADEQAAAGGGHENH